LNPAFNPEEIDDQKALNSVLNKINKLHWTQHPVVVYWQRSAAILLLPLLLSLIYLLVSKEPENITQQEVFAPYGTFVEVNLPDNSKVWLNAGSSLKYPTRFTKGSRKVTLQGEAFFEVESDPENPFTVHTARVDVRATGTAFNVEAYPKDSMTSVTMVREGSEWLSISRSALICFRAKGPLSTKIPFNVKLKDRSIQVVCMERRSDGFQGRSAGICVQTCGANI
jgi:Fe2+-dicitrate sensor, membrane component